MMHFCTRIIDLLHHFYYSQIMTLSSCSSNTPTQDADSVESDAKSLLLAWRQGDDSARDTLFNMLHHELTRISAAYLKREGGVSLSTGDLVNEASMRLLTLNQINWQDKAHFLALAAQTMRRVLIEHARKKHAVKREHHRVTLLSNIEDDKNDELSLYQLDEALIRLQALDKERASIVEMRYFGGLTLEEIAQVTGKSVSTIKRNWRASRAWLINELEVH